MYGSVEHTLVPKFGVKLITFSKDVLERLKITIKTLIDFYVFCLFELSNHQINLKKCITVSPQNIKQCNFFQR